VHCVDVLCQVDMVCCFGVINDKDVIDVPGVKQYAFGLYEGSDVDVF
jgi:hypothetical protein